MRRINREEREVRLHWRDLQLEPIHTYPNKEPTHPKIGDRWYDPEAHCLCIWDGLQWEAVPLD
jgi:hypothetical protein